MTHLHRARCNVTPIEVLRGVSQDALVALKGSGIDSVEGVLAADPDRFAYLVDSYDTAEAIYSAAKKYAAEHPLTQKGVRAEPTPTATTRSSPVSTGDTASRSLVAACKSLAKLSNDRSLAPRLEAAAMVLRAGGSANAASAAFAVDAWFSGAPAIADLSEQVRDIVRGVSAILSVPIGPTGKADPHYPEAVARANDEARLVACACTISALASPLADSAASHATIVSNAIIAAGDGPLVSKLQAALRSARNGS